MVDICVLGTVEKQYMALCVTNIGWGNDVDPKQRTDSNQSE